MTLPSVFLLGAVFAAGCGGDIPINGGQSNLDVDGGVDAAPDAALSALSFPLNGSYYQAAPPFFGCQAGDFTDFMAPASFQVVSTATQVQVVYNGAVRDSWSVGNDGTKTGTYSNDNFTFTLKENALNYADFILARTSTGLSQTAPNTASQCTWPSQ